MVGFEGPNGARVDMLYKDKYLSKGLLLSSQCFSVWELFRQGMASEETGEPLK